MRWRLNDRLWVPADGVIPATAWWDTTLRGGMIPGADPGVRLIPDWSGKERHGLQVLAANQGSISALGPNGDLSVTLDGADDGWRVQGALAYATTRYLFFAPNIISTAAVGQFFQIYVNATHYAVCGHAAGGALQFGDYVAGAFTYRVSSFTVDLGVAHSYGWALDAVAGTVTFYKDGVSDPAGPLVYTPIAPTNLCIGYNTTGAAIAPINGALIRAAWWEGVIP